MADEDQITLTLEGDRAREGVSLAAFDSFVGHFLLALRYYYRSSRTSVVRRSGRPLADEELATNFRLVAFRKGSGVAVLEPALPPDADALTDELPPRSRGRTWPGSWMQSTARTDWTSPSRQSSIRP
jgi:hypothetical protein